MLAASAPTTDQSVHPGDHQRGPRLRQAFATKVKIAAASGYQPRAKPLDVYAPVTEVLSLLYLGSAILPPSPSLAEAGDGAVYGV